MDDLRHDLNEVFERRQADLGDLTAARERMIRNALAAPDLRRNARTQVAAGLAAMLIAAVVIATFAYVRVTSEPSHGGPIRTSQPTPTVASKNPSSLPTGIVTVDGDPISASIGWLLLTNCVQPVTSCHYYATQTTDGGRTWSKAVQVGPKFSPANGDAPRTIRFINTADGFIYGGVEAFVTHDGGRTWGILGLHPTFFDSVLGQGTNAWVVTYPCAKGVVCPYEVRSSVDAGRTWSAPFELPGGFSPMSALTIGNSGLLLASEPFGDLEITLDGGSTWQSVNTPCTGNVYRAIVASADGNELWEWCLEYPNGQTARERLFVSEDAGKTWALRTSSQVSGDQVQNDYLTSLVSVRAGTAVMLGVQSPIKISHDGGRTWRQASPIGAVFGSIRFANATEGWAVDVDKNIWITVDGGDHWALGPA